MRVPQTLKILQASGVGFEHGSAAMVTTTAANPETPETIWIPCEINGVGRIGAGAMDDHRPATPLTMDATMVFLSGAFTDLEKFAI